MTLYACFAHSSGLSRPLWFNRVPAAGEDEVDVWDCGSDLARLKCRKCPNHFVDSTPICPPCHDRRTLTNRVAIRTELLFKFLMTGLGEAMGRAKTA